MPEFNGLPEDLRAVSIAELSRLSGLHPSHIGNIKSGNRRPKPATLARLKLVAVRLRTRQIEAPLAVVLTYRATLALASTVLGVDPAMAQNSDPARKLTGNAEWRSAANARRLAQYLMNTAMGFRQVEVARAAGVTKQAINQAMREIEDEREKGDFDQLVKTLEDAILGGR
jgi:transcriptional regulator with XRE-family HTH domain